MQKHLNTTEPEGDDIGTSIEVFGSLSNNVIMELCTSLEPTLTERVWKAMRGAEYGDGKKDAQVCWKVLSFLGGLSRKDRLPSHKKGLLKKMLGKKVEQEPGRNLFLQPNFTINWAANGAFKFTNLADGKYTKLCLFDVVEVHERFTGNITWLMESCNPPQMSTES